MKRGRTPHGVRGLKFETLACRHRLCGSHPAWGAWIEMPPPGGIYAGVDCRTPHGVRGLKSDATMQAAATSRSHPAWGAWIEILSIFQSSKPGAKSHPAWGAWIEIGTRHTVPLPVSWSHPAWGAWIEIPTECYLYELCVSRTPHGVRGLKLNFMS